MTADGDVVDAGPDCRIPVRQVDWRFDTSGGPGGQHANRSNTAVEARIALRSVDGLTRDARARLIDRYGPVLRAKVNTTRSQHRNRQLALEQLAHLLRRGLQRKAPRRTTKPSPAARRRRLDDKRRRSELKAHRRRPRLDEG